MIKSLAIALALCATTPAMAQFTAGGSSSSDSENKGYNRVAVSYNNSLYSPNIVADGITSIGLNGVGVNFIHGFSLSETLPMFLEVGGNLNFDFGSQDLTDKLTEGEYWAQAKQLYQDINLQVPVNFLWKFNINENFSLDTYFGLNFKLHLSSTQKKDIDTNIPEEVWEEAGIKTEYESISLFDEDKMGKDNTWNRFQMGWHVGVGAHYKKFYLGLQYGTDFIPAYSYSKSDYKINTSNLKVSLGYTF